MGLRLQWLESASKRSSASCQLLESLFFYCSFVSCVDEVIELGIAFVWLIAELMCKNCNIFFFFGVDFGAFSADMFHGNKYKIFCCINCLFACLMQYFAVFVLEVGFGHQGLKRWTQTVLSLILSQLGLVTCDSVWERRRRRKCSWDWDSTKSHSTWLCLLIFKTLLRLWILM